MNIRETVDFNLGPEMFLFRFMFKKRRKCIDVRKTLNGLSIILKCQTKFAKNGYLTIFICYWIFINNKNLNHY